MPELVSSTSSERPKEKDKSVTTPLDSGEDNSDSAIEHMKAIWMDARKKSCAQKAREKRQKAKQKRKRKHRMHQLAQVRKEMSLDC